VTLGAHPLSVGDPLQPSRVHAFGLPTSA
jgi:hypothetical protein